MAKVQIITLDDLRFEVDVPFRGAALRSEVEALARRGVWYEASNMFIAPANIGRVIIEEE